MLPDFAAAYRDLLQAWQHPASRHGMLVHFPIVLGLLGILPVAALAITRFRAYNLKIVCLAWFLLASAGAFVAADAGGDAKDRLVAGQPALTAAETAAVEQHERLGDDGWIWPLIPAALIAITFIDSKRLRPIAGVLAILAALGVAGWVCLTAQAGGRLVYTHGLGVPARQIEPSPPPATP